MRIYNSSMSQIYRLNKGGYIDRDKEISFKFNGKKYFGYKGDTLASALIAVLIPEKIFSRVLFAWTAMGSSFGPAVISKMMKWKISAIHLLISIILGFVLAVIFFLLPNTPGDWLERVMPFMVSLALIYFLKKT